MAAGGERERTSGDPGDEPQPVRIGLVQFDMRPASGLAEFLGRVEFFLEALSAAGADFAVFPEYVTGPLLPLYHRGDTAAAIRELAELTPEVRDFFIRQAVARRINIIAGSMPWMDRYTLYNYSFLCRRDGTWDYQAKLHATPGEEREWAMAGGSEVRAFDTDCGRIGILVCYDSEFPEVARMLADHEVRILFVPYCTDSEAGCLRVRYCAQARAVENECYVAAAGSVGILPNAGYMDLHYARSAVFTPLDTPFPHRGIAVEAPPGIEMCLTAEVDLRLLAKLHTSGSVQNLRQRRRDLRAVPPATS